MNNFIGIGNLTKDPELRYTKENIPVASFSIAINRQKEGVDYIPIKVFGTQAENCKKYLVKGSKVAIDGRIQTSSYEKDEKKYYTTEIKANRVMFLSNNTNTSKSEEKPLEQAKNSATSEDIYKEFGKDIEISDDDELYPF